jgi:hypothetical protein
LTNTNIKKGQKMFKKMMMMVIGVFFVFSIKTFSLYDQAMRIPTTSGAIYHWGSTEKGTWNYVKTSIYPDHKQNESKCETGGSECWLFDYCVDVLDCVAVTNADPKDILQGYINFVTFLNNSASQLLDPSYGYKQIVKQAALNGDTIPTQTQTPTMEIIFNPF